MSSGTCKGLALYDFPTDDAHIQLEEGIQLLSFKKGDVLIIHVGILLIIELIRGKEKDASGWMYGKLGNSEGIFPGSFVKEIQDEEQQKEVDWKAKYEELQVLKFS